jgi:NAD(P)-dependent dehydrogenase (short-subunit alcohol dehydrogenase family)
MMPRTIMGEFDGRVALVTGGASGIGRATCVAFASRGAAVAVCDIDARGGQATVDMIRHGGGSAAFFPVDVTDESRVAAMVDAVLGQLGGLHMAYNNAGVEGMRVRLHETPTEHWRKVMSVNVDGVFFCMKYELAHMVEHGGGAIVNASSTFGLAGGAGGPYPASKHAVVGLTKSVALDYARDGIRVNSIHPGAIETPMIERLRADPVLGEALATMHPMGRMGEPEEIAEAVVWLCSDAASFVTGHTMVVDGGNLAV